MTMLKIIPCASNAFDVELHGYNKKGMWTCLSYLHFTSDGGRLTVTTVENGDIIAEAVDVNNLETKKTIQSFMLHLSVADKEKVEP